MKFIIGFFLTLALAPMALQVVSAHAASPTGSVSSFLVKAERVIILEAVERYRSLYDLKTDRGWKQLARRILRDQDELMEDYRVKPEKWWKMYESPVREDKKQWKEFWESFEKISPNELKSKVSALLRLEQDAMRSDLAHLRFDTTMLELRLTAARDKKNQLEIEAIRSWYQNMETVVLQAHEKTLQNVEAIGDSMERLVRMGQFRSVLANAEREMAKQYQILDRVLPESKIGHKPRPHGEKAPLDP